MGLEIKLGEFIDHFYECPNIKLVDNKGNVLFEGNSYELPLEYDNCDIKELRQGEVIGVTIWK